MVTVEGGGDGVWRCRPCGTSCANEAPGVVGDHRRDLSSRKVFGVLLQYPDTTGEAEDLRGVIAACVTLGFAVGVYGISFGVASIGSGATIAQTCVISLLVFTGASQFSAVGVIASGGVGTLDHLASGVIDGGAAAVLAASIFHFREFSIADTKRAMSLAGIEVRPAG